MIITDIDKHRYKSHMKKIMLACVVYLAVVALSVSSVLIAFLGGPEGSNFWLNLAGVIVAAVSLGALFKQFKDHEFFRECRYVYRLKAQINQIYRRLRELEQAAGVVNKDGRAPLSQDKIRYSQAQALQILDWYYRACEQLYRLDDNTITLPELAAKAREITALQETHQVNRVNDQCPCL